MRALSSWLGAMSGLLALTFTSLASASDSYPGALQEALDMSCPPPCTVCHADSSGGLGTVYVEDGGRAFGEAMMEIGLLEAKKPGMLREALELLEQAGVDSDGDGVTDVAALRAGLDPNAGGSVCGPTYGCGASVAPRRPSSSPDALALGAAACVALTLLRLRKRRARVT